MSESGEWLQEEFGSWSATAPDPVLGYRKFKKEMGAEEDMTSEERSRVPTCEH